MSSGVSQGFSINYQSSRAGVFEVLYGNGIVRIRPLDDKALETLVPDDKFVFKELFNNK